MPGASEFSIPLGLSAIPETDDAKNFAEFLRVYNAIKNVMGAVDRYTGTMPPTQEEIETQTVAQTLASMTRNNRVYLQAGEHIDTGRLCYLNPDGKVYQDPNSRQEPHLYPTSNFDIRFFSSADYEADDFGVFYTKGVISVDAALLTPGKVYSVQGPGYLDDTVGDGQQVVGYALTPTDFWFEPQIRFYVAP